jgi:hypothetical protein
MVKSISEFSGVENRSDRLSEFSGVENRSDRSVVQLCMHD